MIIYPFLAIYTLVCFAAVCVAWALTVWWDPRRRFIHLVSRIWTRGYFVLNPLWKITVEGVVPKGAYVVVANHRSMLDIVAMYALPIGNFKWVSKREVYRWPIFGWVLWMRGDIAIERGSAKAVRQMMAEGVNWLRQGVSIVVFPEGTRRKAQDLGPFHDGAFALARVAGVDILPVILTGADTAFSGKLNVFTIKILSPMKPDSEQVREAMGNKNLVSNTK